MAVSTCRIYHVCCVLLLCGSMGAACPSEPCDCVPLRTQARIVVNVTSGGAPLANASVFLRSMSLASCRSDPFWVLLNPGPTVTDATGKASAVFLSTFGPGPQCVRALAFRGAVGGADSLSSPHDTIVFVPEREPLTDSTTINLAFP